MSGRSRFRKERSEKLLEKQRRLQCKSELYLTQPSNLVSCSRKAVVTVNKVSPIQPPLRWNAYPLLASSCTNIPFQWATICQRSHLSGVPNGLYDECKRLANPQHSEFISQLWLFVQTVCMVSQHHPVRYSYMQVQYECYVRVCTLWLRT